MAVRPFSPNFTVHTVNAGVAGVLANRFTQISLKGGLIFGVCGELSSLVSRFAVSFFTNNEAVARTTSRAARLLGGYYLGNIALQAAGCAALAFTPATVLISLLAPIAMPVAASIIADIRDAIFGASPAHSTVRT